ncbi:hypothetical protein [Glaciecola sp. 1036]|uniref:hypothetical protein n=1 Tax=Alteromonadaceae TaxID=72275 RepID=UPI003CFDC2F1
MKKLFAIFLCVGLLSGCELTQQPAQITTTEEVPAPWLCQSESAQGLMQEFCHMESWAKFYVASEEIEWPRRKEQIETLSDEPYDLMRKILLSQGTDTPYRYRLRAQGMITVLQEVVEDNFDDALETIIYKPSQQMLEMESAITILSKVNARQEKELDSLNSTLEKRKVELEKQREQVEQLLKIEANMVDQNSEQ